MKIIYKYVANMRMGLMYIADSKWPLCMGQVIQLLSCVSVAICSIMTLAHCQNMHPYIHTQWEHVHVSMGIYLKNSRSQEYIFKKKGLIEKSENKILQN